MRILAYVYDFPHFKSAQGLFALRRAGFRDVTVIGAPWRKLGLPESPYQFRTWGMSDAHHPREASAALGYEYNAWEHDSEHALCVLRDSDVGLVLGARVLPERVIDVGTPIVNLHPGVLPLNRGLDTLKWAVHDRLPQAVTAHIIDRRVDRGALLFEDVVSVHSTDSPADVYNRMMWTQIEAIPRAIEASHEPGDEIGQGVYRRPMTAEQDRAVLLGFETYKYAYPGICKKWMARKPDEPNTLESEAAYYADLCPA